MDVLIVEDEGAIAMMLADVFKRDHGIACRRAVSQKVGLRMIQERRPNILTLDLRMKDTVVGQTLPTFRAAVGNETYILVVSANPMDVSERLADDYVNKPFSLVEMSTSIRRAVRQATADQELSNALAELARLKGGSGNT